MDTVRTGPETWEALADCEAAVVIFPLYVDSLPSHLLRFFMEWEMDRREQQRRALSLYAVAQCGFYEGEQNRIALEQVSCFCRKAGISWQGGVGLGGAGGFAAMSIRDKNQDQRSTVTVHRGKNHNLYNFLRTIIA